MTIDPSSEETPDLGLLSAWKFVGSTDHLASVIDAFCAAVTSHYGLAELDVAESDGVLSIRSLSLPRRRRGKGAGRLVLAELLGRADRLAERVEILPSARTEQDPRWRARHERWLERLGFVSDPERPDVLVRLPEAPSESATVR